MGMSDFYGGRNDERSIDLVHLGVMSVKAGATGAVLLDEFESRRATYIGPL